MKPVLRAIGASLLLLALTACVVAPEPFRGRVVVGDGWHNHHCWRCW